ncbi:MAG: HIT domain-containing protein [archaeon]
MLSKEQADNIKKELLNQLESFPAEQRETVKAQIEAMNPEQLEQFLIQNKLIKDGENGKCIFCEITGGSVPSFKIDENAESIAVLELNPLSKGHIIIIPKKHLAKNEIPKSSYELADSLSEKLKKKFNSEKVEISESEFLGHGILNIIPSYSGAKLEKKQASKEELESLQKELLAEEASEKQEIIEEPEEKVIYRAPRRIP